jgi:hypothetical protein
VPLGGNRHPEEYWPKAPTTVLPSTVKALVGFLGAVIDEAPCRFEVMGARRLGVISLAGPRQCLTVVRIQSVAPAVAAGELASESSVSGPFSKTQLGTG